MMTVRELRSKLFEMDQDATVVVYEPSTGWYSHTAEVSVQEGTVVINLGKEVNPTTDL